jgi:hypothetical protein
MAANGMARHRGSSEATGNPEIIPQRPKTGYRQLRVAVSARTPGYVEPGEEAAEERAGQDCGEE